MALDLRPNFNIPLDAFKRQEDPYGQVLPGFIQGQTAANTLAKKRAIMQGMQGMMQSPLAQGDPITQALGKFAQSDPDVAMALMPTIAAGLYKRAAKQGTATRTIYQDPKSGDVSGVNQNGWQPVTLPEAQATLRLQTQGEANRRSGRFNQVMGLNVGKAANKIDMDEGSLVDQATQLEGYLRGLQVQHAQLYPKYGGMARGRATRMISNATGGTASVGTPFGNVPIPGSDPEVAAYNQKIDGTIQLLAPFLKEKGKLSDKDAEQRLGQLKASLNKDPKAVAKLYDDLIGILGAIKTNDVGRANRAYARLGIKSRLTPNPENAKLLMQQQFMAQMAAGGGQNPFAQEYAGQDPNALMQQLQDLQSEE